VISKLQISGKRSSTVVHLVRVFFALTVAVLFIISLASIALAHASVWGEIAIDHSNNLRTPLIRLSKVGQFRN